jgi:hypothetical protein
MKQYIFIAAFILSFFIISSPSPAFAATTLSIDDFYSLSSTTDLGLAGNSVAIGDLDGDGVEDMIIGEPDNDNGYVYIFYGGSQSDLVSGSMSVSDADATITGSAGAGYTVTTGDFNNDGKDDLVITQCTGGCTGSVSIIYGSTTRLSGSSTITSLADATFTGSITEKLGHVLSAGDVNNDNYDDLLIGNDDQSGDPANTYLIYGQSAQLSGTSTISSVADAIFEGEFEEEIASEGAGRAIDMSGDINGDGFNDIIISAYANGGQVGKVYIIYGQSSAFSGTADISTVDDATFQGRYSDDSIGEYIASSDVNGDGYDEILMGVRDESNSGAGGVYVVYGQSAEFSGNTPMSGSNVFFRGETAENNAYYPSPAVGDLNGDGYDELVIGASHRSPNSVSTAGTLYIVYGQATNFSAGITNLSTADVVINGTETAMQLGAVPIATGNLNNDTYRDIIIGAPLGESAYYGYLGLDNDADSVLGSSGLLYTGTDCNDSDATVSANQLFYIDSDGDGIGGMSTGSVCASSAPAGYSSVNTDCNDADSAVSSNQTYYVDSDGDGLGDPSQSSAQCFATAPSGYASNDDDTNDTIKNNGVEIDDDGVDNDGDGTIDEVNTISSNGKHPEYQTYDAGSKDVYAAAVEEIKGAKNGRMTVRFADNSVYRYDVFDLDTDSKTKVKSFNSKGYILVLHPKGKKLALVNVYTGKVMERETITDTKYSSHSIKLKDLRGDGKTDAVLTSKKDANVLVSIVTVKPTKDNKLKLRDKEKLSNSNVEPKETVVKEKKILLKNADEKTIITLLVNSEYTMSVE